jgi:hypothetical protein
MTFIVFQVHVHTLLLRTCPALAAVLQYCERRVEIVVAGLAAKRAGGTTQRLA